MIDFVTDQEKDYHYQSSISIIFEYFCKKTKNKKIKMKNLDERSVRGAQSC